jgi:hypothetical protein
LDGLVHQISDLNLNSRLGGKIGRPAGLAGLQNYSKYAKIAEDLIHRATRTSKRPVYLERFWRGFMIVLKVLRSEVLVEDVYAVVCFLLPLKWNGILYGRDSQRGCLKLRQIFINNPQYIYMQSLKPAGLPFLQTVIVQQRGTDCAGAPQTLHYR